MWNEVEISWCLSGVRVPDELQYKMAQRCLHDFTIFYMCLAYLTVFRIPTFTSCWQTGT